MDGIKIGIDPVIFHIGMFELRWYSLAILLAVVAAVLVTVHQARKRGILVAEEVRKSGEAGDQRKKGPTAADIYTLAVYCVIGGVIGARLFHVIDRWDYYSQYPAQIIQFQQGGLAIWGGLVGGVIALFAVALAKRMPLFKLLDCVAPALLVAHIIGRFGCIVNGDAYGGVTTLPWGFIYTHPDASIPADLAGLPTHPYPVYEQIWNLVALGVVLYLGRRVRKDGILFLTYLMFYSMARFVLTFVRQETITAWGLQQAQIIALVIFVVALGVTVFLSLRRVPAQATTEPQ